MAEASPRLPYSGSSSASRRRCRERRRLSSTSARWSRVVASADTPNWSFFASATSAWPHAWDAASRTFARRLGGSPMRESVFRQRRSGSSKRAFAGLGRELHALGGCDHLPRHRAVPRLVVRDPAAPLRVELAVRLLGNDDGHDADTDDEQENDDADRLHGPNVVDDSPGAKLANRRRPRSRDLRQFPSSLRTLRRSRAASSGRSGSSASRRRPRACGPRSARSSTP